MRQRHGPHGLELNLVVSHELGNVNCRLACEEEELGHSVSFGACSSNIARVRSHRRRDRQIHA